MICINANRRPANGRALYTVFVSADNSDRWDSVNLCRRSQLTASDRFHVSFTCSQLCEIVCVCVS